MDSLLHGRCVTEAIFLMFTIQRFNIHIPDPM